MTSSERVVNTESWVQVPTLFLTWKSLWLTLSFSFLVCNWGTLSVLTMALLWGLNETTRVLSWTVPSRDGDSILGNCYYQLSESFLTLPIKMASAPPYTQATAWLWLSFSAVEGKIPVSFTPTASSQNSNNEWEFKWFLWEREEKERT